ncbi:MAG: endonuclease/exonuclease/phosphatase family protein, partial [Gammaproteobacteria bacterium]|nr:endonuclease/exonuclease/phosphatase family protein [Gammaproteobacteria bacterium]
LKSVFRLFVALLLVFATAIGVLWARSYTPQNVEMASIRCSDDAPAWSTSAPLKIMSYNVQYMASKNYVFFYDIDINNPGHIDAVVKAGKTVASYPSREHVLWTLDEVAALIEKEKPDLVMMQEVNGEDDSRTYYIDHVSELLKRLPADYFPCQSDAPYWKAEFIFHPDILGPVDMRLLTLSKYRLVKSVRHQLPRWPRNFLVTPFHFQRALLESHLATDRGDTVALINTHFDAWAAGTGIMEKQVARTAALLQSLDDAGTPWVLGGDLNLLPPDDDRQRQKILAAGTGIYDENSQIKPLYDKYRGVPPLQQLTADDPRPWYTHFPNDPAATGPDRTIDYLFYSDQWVIEDQYVIQQEALHISDHLPVVGVYSFSPSM